MAWEGPPGPLQTPEAEAALRIVRKACGCKRAASSRTFYCERCGREEMLTRGDSSSFGGRERLSAAWSDGPPSA